jgi:hypothetical protein
MISTDLLRVTSCLASTHRRHPETLSSLVPLFAGVVAMTQRDLITYLLNTEADWPWHEQQQQRPQAASMPSRE